MYNTLFTTTVFALEYETDIPIKFGLSRRMISAYNYSFIECQKKAAFNPIFELFFFSFVMMAIIIVLAALNERKVLKLN